MTQIVTQAHDRATSVLRGHMDELEKISRFLIQAESIEVPTFEALLKGEDVPVPASNRDSEPEAESEDPETSPSPPTESVPRAPRLKRDPSGA